MKGAGKAGSVPVGISALGRFGKNDGDEIPSLIDEKDTSLNPAEAVYGFAAYLTTRDKRSVFSAFDDAAPAADLAEGFLKANGMSGKDISDNWPNNLIHPKK